MTRYGYHLYPHTHPHEPHLSFAEEFVLESAAIEGQHIPYDEIASTWHYAAYMAAIELASQQEPLTNAHIKNWQAAVVREQTHWGDHAVRGDAIGAYRKTNIHLRYGDGSTKQIGCAPEDVETRMASLIGTIEGGLKNERDDTWAIPLAAAVHYDYERIHPFIDGNGRSGRILAAYILAYLGVPPVMFTSHDRGVNYYPCFEASDDSLMRAYFVEHQFERPGLPTP